MLLLAIRWFRGGASFSEEANIFPEILIQCRKQRLLHQHQNNFTFRLNATPSLKATPRPREKQERKCRQRELLPFAMCPHHTTTAHPGQQQHGSPWIVPSGHGTGHRRGRVSSGPFQAVHTSLQWFLIILFSQNQDDLEQHLKSYFSHSEALVFPAMVKVEGSYIFLKAASTRHEHFHKE